MDFEVWKAWGKVHDDPQQLKRIEKAYQEECTPASIDLEAQTGLFYGSSGGQYTTTLDSCDCVDFLRRDLPCKHIYRLAIELGAFGQPEKLKRATITENRPSSSRHKVHDLALHVVTLLEKYPEELQKEFKEILYHYMYHDNVSSFYPDARSLSPAIADGLLIATPCPKVAVKKFCQITRKAELENFLKQHEEQVPIGCARKTDMVDWMMNHLDKYGPIAGPHYREIVLSDEILPAKNHIYKYLHRKFDPVAVSEYQDFGMPNDFATEMLNMFGTNPLK